MTVNPEIIEALTDGIQSEIAAYVFYLEAIKIVDDNDGSAYEQNPGCDIDAVENVASPLPPNNPPNIPKGVPRPMPRIIYPIWLIE